MTTKWDGGSLDATFSDAGEHSKCESCTQTETATIPYAQDYMKNACTGETRHDGNTLVDRWVVVVPKASNVSSYRELDVTHVDATSKGVNADRPIPF